MQLMRRVALGGVQLDSVDPAIVIQGIEPQAGKDSVTSVPRGASGGSRVTGQRRDYLEIAVKFTINEKSYRPEARATVLEKVCRWAAAGGVLTVNYKPGRQARVICAQLPGEGDAAKRGTYTVTFRAYGVPYWTEPTGTVLTASNTNDTSVSSDSIGGSCETVAEFTFTNLNSSTCTWVQVIGPKGSVKLNQIALAQNETIHFDHDADGLQRIWIMNAAGDEARSAMGTRVADVNIISADELYVDPGSASFSLLSDKKGDWTVTIKGRYA